MELHEITFRKAFKIVFSFMKDMKYRLLAIFSSMFYIVFLFVVLGQQFKTIDPEPVLLHQIDEKAKSKASVVSVGLHIHNFPEASFVKGEFLIDGIIWFSFPVGTESLKTVENFSIQNSLMQENGELIYKSNPIIKLIEDRVLLCYHIQTVFKAPLSHRNFPLKPYRLKLVIQNRSVTPHELCFESSNQNLTLSNERVTENWRPTKKKVRTGYVKSILSNTNKAMEISYPVTVFSIDFEKRGMRDSFSLYFPMFVVFFIALFCLLISVNDISRLSYVASAVPVLVLFRMVIDGASPRVSHTTHVDFIFYLLVFLSLFVLLFQTYAVLMLEKIKSLPSEEQRGAKIWLERANNAVFFITLALLILFVTWSFFR
jgi:hypothetical protein